MPLTLTTVAAWGRRLDPPIPATRKGAGVNCRSAWCSRRITERPRRCTLRLRRRVGVGPGLKLLRLLEEERRLVEEELLVLIVMTFVVAIGEDEDDE